MLLQVKRRVGLSSGWSNGISHMGGKSDEKGSRPATGST